MCACINIENKQDNNAEAFCVLVFIHDDIVAILALLCATRLCASTLCQESLIREDLNQIVYSIVAV